MEKYRFGAKKGVSHYVFKLTIVMLAKTVKFEGQICVKPKKRMHGTVARSPPVAEMIASETRQPRT